MISCWVLQRVKGRKPLVRRGRARLVWRNLLVGRKRPLFSKLWWWYCLHASAAQIHWIFIGWLRSRFWVLYVKKMQRICRQLRACGIIQRACPQRRYIWGGWWCGRYNKGSCHYNRIVFGEGCFESTPFWVFWWMPWWWRGIIHVLWYHLVWFRHRMKVSIFPIINLITLPLYILTIIERRFGGH